MLIDKATNNINDKNGELYNTSKFKGYKALIFFKGIGQGGGYKRSIKCRKKYRKNILKRHKYTRKQSGRVI